MRGGFALSKFLAQLNINERQGHLESRIIWTTKGIHPNYILALSLIPLPNSPPPPSPHQLRRPRSGPSFWSSRSSPRFWRPRPCSRFWSSRPSPGLRGPRLSPSLWGPRPSPGLRSSCPGPSLRSPGSCPRLRVVRWRSLSCRSSFRFRCLWFRRLSARSGAAGSAGGKHHKTQDQVRQPTPPAQGTPRPAL